MSTAVIPTFVVSGTATVEHLPAFSVSGTAVVADAHVPPFALNVYVTKGVLPTPKANIPLYWKGTGGAIAGGRAGIAGDPWIPDGGGVAGGAAAVIFPYNPQGGVIAGGAATVTAHIATVYDIAVLDAMPSGGALIGGAAVVKEAIAFVPKGGAVAGGAAIVQDAINFKPSGGGLAGGTAPSPGVFTGTTSGGGLAGGAAPSKAAFATPVSGGAVAGGAATVSDRQAWYAPSGGALAGGAALAYMIPSGFITTPENPFGDAFPGWAVNFDTGAPSRYSGLPANSLTQLAGVTYVANAGGVYALDAQNDAGQPIHAEVMLPDSDHGDPHNKRLPHVWIGAEMAAAMVLKVVTDNADERYYTVDPPDGAMRATMVDLGKGVEGRFIRVGLANVAGADFTLESLELPLSILKRRGR